MRRLQFCLAVFAVLALSFSAFAQIQNGQFTGTVTDPSGAAIPGAKVTVTNNATNLSASTTTNQSGSYTLRELPVGTYKLTTEAAGFKTVSDTNVVLNAGVIAHVDFKMTMGQAKEVVEVTGVLAQVNTEDSKLASTVSSTQISNLPLNGRNVYDLMQLSTGAVNVTGVDFENGHSTVVNGVREDFNGFLINGVSNKGLSGGAVNVPIQDTVEEFQQLQLNMSAQYGNSAGGTVNLVTKSGTNQLHGSAWWFGRNDAFDANQYFVNQAGQKIPALRFNQFGFTLGGPIMKDKLFFFGSYQGDRFRTVATPITVTEETPDWRTAVIKADQNSTVSSVAGLLYGTFTPKVPAVPGSQTTFDNYLTTVAAPLTTSGFGCVGPVINGVCVSGVANYADYICPDNYGPNGMGGTLPQANAIAARMQAILGVVPSVDNSTVLSVTGAPCSTPFASPVAGTIGRDPISGISILPFQQQSIAIFKSQTQSLGNLFNGNEASLRLDYNWNASNRLSANYNLSRTTDSFGPCAASCSRGFQNPFIGRPPNGQLSWVHTFTPTILNEARVGYAQNTGLVNVAQGGVPSTAFDDGSVGFGSYNGYPQFFKENIYTYSDMVSVTHGNHNMKIGVDFRRNIENSEFNVARPSYYFSDPIFFAADAPYSVSAGVNPGICAPPCTSFNQSPQANLESNFRHWRNLEMGTYFQDDWKVTKRLTLQLGLRYDLYRRHNEENNKATTFIPGPGSNVLDQLINANIPVGNPGCTDPNQNTALAQLAGVCGPGGFAPANSLGKGRHKDFGPRVGFAWDVFGDGKTSLRGGFGIAYEGTLYNPLSNSRWNLPYYSFNNVTNFLGFDVNSVVYGPTDCTGGGGYPLNCVPTGGAQFGPGGTTPSFIGAVSGKQGQGGFGAQAQGNIDGWNPQSPNLALLTGIIFPKGIDDPYVYNYYLGFQREIMPKTVVEFNYVGTTGHKLFRSEDINRAPGTLLPGGVQIVDNLGRTLTGRGHRPNPNYGRLRVWENVVNSNYNSLQASVKHQMSHGLLFNVNYTYSHSIDNGSTWHSGATTANGQGAGEGFTLDQTLPQLDRGNSIYDIRHRLVINHVWQLPGYNMKGVGGAILGGWSLSGIWSFQSGAHWEPVRLGRARLKGDCSQSGVNSGLCVNRGGDYNLDRGRNDRPNSSVKNFGNFNRSTWANGFDPSTGVSPGGQTGLPILTAPCLGCTGNLGRNQFVGPGQWIADLTMSKNFKLTERFNLKFEADGFNVFNRANFLLATAGGGAHNSMTDGEFGKAAGTLNARNMQFGLKLSF